MSTGSKFGESQTPVLVERGRLIRKLDTDQGRRIVLIAAQAAQGKTTLAASYLAASRERAAWVHLEKKDSDIANLFYLAVHALEQAFPGEDLSGFLKAPAMALGAQIDVSRYKDRFMHVFDRLPRPVLLIFDGLENLDPGSPSMRLIDELIHAAPAGVRMFLISREIPPLRLQRLKVNQELTVVSNEDLAFSTEEVNAFFRLRDGLVLLPEQIEQIQKMTGGWVGGLVLISESLRKVPEADRTPWLDSQLPDLLKGEVLRYFSEEVLAAQPENARDLLILSSLLDVIDPKILGKLAREPDTEIILQEWVQRNLFLHPINDPRKGILYRHNRMFRDFLFSLFQNRLSKKQQKKILNQVGEIFWEDGELEKSVDFFLRAGKTERAVDGIIQTAMDLTVRGRFTDLAKWIDALPEQRVSKDPWLLFYRTLARRISGGKQTLADLTAVLALFRSGNDVRGEMLALGYLIEAGVFLGADPSTLHQWIQEGEILLKRWSEKPFYAYAKAMLWLQIGFGQIAVPADLQKGLSACQNAYLLSLKIEDRTLQVNATIVSILGMAVSGDFFEADRALERIEQIGAAVYPEYRVLHALVDIQLALNRGDFDRALQALERSRHGIETFGLLFVYPAFVETAGRLALYRKDFSEAERCSSHLSDVAVMADNPYYRSLSLRLAAMIRYHTGDFEAAHRLASQALSNLPDTLGTGIHRLRLKQLQGLIDLHLGDLKKAENRLKEVLSPMAGAPSSLTLAETHLGLGLVYHGAGDDHMAQAHLRLGFSIAEEKGYEHFLMMRPADVAGACLLTTASEGPEGKYASRLLSSRLISTEEADVEPMLRDSRTAYRSPPVSVRRALYRSRLPQIEIITFGGFVVLKDGQAPIEDYQWSGTRPKLLLKSLVAHGGRDIPKDILIEDLWPESDGESAAKSFKVTLHRLRKILEPELSRELGSAYLHLKDNLVSLDPDLCRIDVEEFLALSKEIRNLGDRESPDALLDRCVRAAALYRGDFLPEEPYLSWVEMKRTVLQDNYLEIMAKAIDLYSAANRLSEAADSCKRILRVDPSSDSACQRLMELYHRQGKRTAALKVYGAFKAHVVSEIGVEPDPQTTAMYRKLQNIPGAGPADEVDKKSV
jgi:ATP/maltotriose-dependent transcriptional regulator MalT/DNA-binding SARP family transcriptional activator